MERLICTSTGGTIHYKVTGISHPEHIRFLDNPGAMSEINSDLRLLLMQGIDYGQFTSGFTIPASVAGEEVKVKVDGAFHIAPDVRLLCRILKWHYNFCPDEALTQEDFRKAYGAGFGDHFYARWRNLDMDIMKMLGYFGCSYDNGQRFLGIVMKKVFRYEQRAKRENAQIIKELFEGTALSVSGSGEADSAGQSEHRGEAGDGDHRTGKGNLCGASAGTDGLDTSDPAASAAP